MSTKFNDAPSLEECVTDLLRDIAKFRDNPNNRDCFDFIRIFGAARLLENNKPYTNYPELIHRLTKYIFLEASEKKIAKWDGLGWIMVAAERVEDAFTYDNPAVEYMKKAENQIKDIDPHAGEIKSCKNCMRPASYEMGKGCAACGWIDDSVMKDAPIMAYVKPVSEQPDLITSIQALLDSITKNITDYDCQRDESLCAVCDAADQVAAALKEYHQNH